MKFELLVGTNNLLSSALPTGELVTPNSLTVFEGGFSVGVTGSPHSSAVLVDFAEDQCWLICTGPKQEE